MDSINPVEDKENFDRVSKTRVIDMGWIFWFAFLISFRKDEQILLDHADESLDIVHRAEWQIGYDDH